MLLRLQAGPGDHVGVPGIAGPLQKVGAPVDAGHTDPFVGLSRAMGVHLPATLRFWFQIVEKQVAPVAEPHLDAAAPGPVNAVGRIEERIASCGHDGLVAALGIGLPFVLDHHGHVGAPAIPAHVQDVVGFGPLVFHLVQIGLDPVHPVGALGVAHVMRRPLVRRVLLRQARVPHPESPPVVEDLSVGVGAETVETARRTGSKHRVGRMLLHGLEALDQSVGLAHLQHVQEEDFAARLHPQVRDRHPVEKDPAAGRAGGGQCHPQTPGAG